ncbi:autotransporter domain-containing protein [Maricaulis sp. D1M11]|uniref:autotransporter domain-containing protein n=1 Tax=Maricaulis sp. D1M11 TaxID=3076117 RepID=UPI0039B4A49B
MSRLGLKGLMAASASAIALIAAGAANALPVRDDIGPDGAFDVNNQWAGVGMMFSNGFVCTGQLVNARTVIFAAHCVDNLPDEAYGSNFGGTGMVFSFAPDAFPGIVDWFNRGFQTNTDLLAYNVLQVQTVTNQGLPFPGADVAMATLDTPAIGLPTYGMLFSPVTETTAVSTVGYGRHGTGSGGDFGDIDWRRRAGTNMLDGLFSQDDFLAGLFGHGPGLWSNLVGPSGGQLLYHMDFDRPDRDEEDCARGAVFAGDNDYVCFSAFGGNDNTGLVTFDNSSVFLGTDNINWFGGGATDGETGTAGGDSGSAMFANIGGQNLILGVLSGGWGFTSPNGGYGDVSYYNPLFLYQNWIIDSNPMVYASAVEGDGNWSDASHWQQDLDPNYYVLDAEGNAVNGTNPDAPTDLTGALGTQDPAWGTILDTTVSDIRARGQATEGEGSAATDANTFTTASTGVAATNAVGTATLPGFTPDAAVTGAQVNVLDSLNKTGNVNVSDPLAALNGVSSDLIAQLPAGWVPNNDFGTYGTFQGAASGTTARFYDVNLSRAGTTTVDMNVELDGFTISHTDAALVVGENYVFNTLIAFNQFAGDVEINGVVNAREYMLAQGMLSGSGLLNTSALWNVAGAVNPGEVGGVGELTLWGDYVQTLGGGLVIDFDGSGSDHFNILGDASIDGLLALNPVGGYVPRYGDSFTFLTVSGEMIGDFAAITDLPGVLTPILSQENGSLSIELMAADFSSQASFTNGAQETWGSALDAFRDDYYADLATLYGVVDLLQGDDLTTAFDTLTPHDAVQFDRNVRSQLDALSSALSEQLGVSSSTYQSVSSTDIAMASLSQRGKSLNGNARVFGQSPVLAASAMSSAIDGHGDHERNGYGFRAFGSAGVISGETLTFANMAQSDLDGEFALLGGDYAVTDSLRIGAAFGWADGDTEAGSALGNSSSSVTTTQVNAFASYTRSGLLATININAAQHEHNGTRTATLGNVATTIASDHDADSTGISAHVQWDNRRGETGWRFVPMASISSWQIDYDAAPLTPGLGNGTIQERSTYSTVGRGGGVLSWVGDSFTAGLYVGGAKEFGDDREAYRLSLVNGTAATVGFETGLDVGTSWQEVAASVSTELPWGAEVSASYEVDYDREFLEAEVFTVNYQMPF